MNGPRARTWSASPSTGRARWSSPATPSRLTPPTSSVQGVAEYLADIESKGRSDTVPTSAALGRR